MSLDAVGLSILLPPLLAGLLVLSTHVPLGQEVLRRGIIFIDLAVAQIAGLGLMVAVAAGWDIHGWQAQAVTVTSALGGAALLGLIERYWPAQQEAFIGTAFVLAASGGLLLMHGEAHGAEHMKDLLAGQLLWVRPAQLLWVAPLYAGLLVAWYALPPARLKFYLLFAVAVTASVQLVGVYLVFASLIVPALAVRQLGGRRALAAGYAIGAAGYVAGLLLSLWFDLPAGPAVVWMLAAMGLLSSLGIRCRVRAATRPVNARRAPDPPPRGPSAC